MEEVKDTAKTTTSCRLTRAQKRAVELAAARAGYDYTSRWVKETLLQRIREELGEHVLKPNGGQAQ